MDEAAFIYAEARIRCGSNQAGPHPYCHSTLYGQLYSSYRRTLVANHKHIRSKYLCRICGQASHRWEVVRSFCTLLYIFILYQLACTGELR